MGSTILALALAGATTAAWATAPSKAPSHMAVHAARPNVSGVLNVNRATRTELQLLPGIDRSKADAILSARRARPFATVDDMTRAHGIDRSWVDVNRTYLTVNGASTLHREGGSQHKATKR